MGIPIGDGEVVFRCNLVAVRDGRMWSYSSGHISSRESHRLIQALNESLSGDGVRFHPGVSYRHILKVSGREEMLGAICTPPHDISGQPIERFLPRGPGSGLLRRLMEASEEVLREHPVNQARRAAGKVPATMIWLFWGSGRPPQMPAFAEVRGLRAAMTSAVDLLNGLARLVGMDVLSLPGVTDGQDNDYVSQATGALQALDGHDLVVVHIEAPDEAAHSGSAEAKIEAIERVDREVVGRVAVWKGDALRVLLLPDHPTPVATQAHSGEPVPFMLWGHGFAGNGARRFTEAEAAATGLFVDPGYNIMGWLVGAEPGG
jgi:2,3-bisphosphoglycerate-independent phosphoglycerate mutase